MAVAVFAAVGFAGYWKARRRGLTRSKCFLRDTRLVLAYLGVLLNGWVVGDVCAGGLSARLLGRTAGSGNGIPAGVVPSVQLALAKAVNKFPGIHAVPGTLCSEPKLDGYLHCALSISGRSGCRRSVSCCIT